MKWQPLRRTEVHGPSGELIAATIQKQSFLTEKGAREWLDKEIEGCEWWVNDLYQIEVRRFDNSFVHLNIRRHDGKAIMRDWRHFQQIKNELIGPECEAMELYPAESRLVDTSNKYHLYGVADPTFRFPIGFKKRDVIDEHRQEQTTPGLNQRGGVNV